MGMGWGWGVLVVFQSIFGNEKMDDWEFFFEIASLILIGVGHSKTFFPIQVVWYLGSDFLERLLPRLFFRQHFGK